MLIHGPLSTESAPVITETTEQTHSMTMFAASTADALARRRSAHGIFRTDVNVVPGSVLIAGALLDLQLDEP